MYIINRVFCQLPNTTAWIIMYVKSFPSLYQNYLLPQITVKVCLLYFVPSIFQLFY